jgi:4-hydroxythreonine-4-phosphate dehydrogenase
VSTELGSIGAVTRPGGHPAPLAVTMGDPAGIGLDITLSAFTHHRSALPAFVLYADPSAIADRAKRLGLTVSLVVVEQPSDAIPIAADALVVVPIPLAVEAVAGRPDASNGKAVIAAIEQATAAVAAGHAAALVTNPISKATLYAAGFRHPGHTEFLAELSERHWPGAKVVPVMMLASDELRVVPLTIHIPLADVPAQITTSLIEGTAHTLAAALRRYFAIANPRIAIAGLNPHAGEGGTIGREDVEVIAPAVAALQKAGLRVVGPQSADTLFHAAARARYDAAIAMYHDQALIPIKTLAFDTGVNVTLGLPFVRTSPDHGTAFDIAGTGRADPSSFVAALKLAERMAARAVGDPVI